jgi:flap endonuclease-1
MGVDLGDLFERKEIEFSDLKGKIIAINAYNTLYQFLSIIRQRDGTPLIDSHGETTSHLSGFLYPMFPTQKHKPLAGNPVPSRI